MNEIAFDDAMGLTASQFAWACVGNGDYPPPEPKAKRASASSPKAISHEPPAPRYGTDARCWLCGGATHGVGWPWRLAIPPTYTNHTLAKVPDSRTVCQPCAALGSKDTWEAYARRRPHLGLKTGHAMSWRCYSHVFSSGLHDCPTRARWRAWLLAPPEPPFLCIIAESGQKHLIFRGRIAYERDCYPVQFEEEPIVVHRFTFARCLRDFERLYALGFSKDSIRSGRYHHAQLMTVGLAAWREAEAQFAPWRRSEPGLVALCHYCAQKSKGTERKEG